MSLPHITICDCVTERTGKPHVTIPRAQHEALMAGMRAIQRYLAGDTSCNGGAKIMFEKVYTQARAAGIDTEDKT